MAGKSSAKASESSKQNEEKEEKKSTAVGPRDGKRAFDRCKSVLSKLDPDVRKMVVSSIAQYGQLCNMDELEGPVAEAPVQQSNGRQTTLI